MPSTPSTHPPHGRQVGEVGGDELLVGRQIGRVS